MQKIPKLALPKKIPPLTDELVSRLVVIVVVVCFAVSLLAVLINGVR